MRAEYAVIVFGAGTAGIVAAIQAARAGAPTLLVEKNGLPGGTMTTAGVNRPAHFFARGKQVIAGIGWELVRRTLEETGCPVPGPGDRPGPIGVNAAVFACLCDEALLESGVSVLYHAMPAALAFRETKWSVTLCAKEGPRETSARVLVDATGDANAAALAGFEVTRPQAVQPASLRARFSGYDPDTLDYRAIGRAFREALEAGEIMTTDFSWSDLGPEKMLRAGSTGQNHVSAPDAGTSAGRTTAEIAGRASVMRAFRFFRRQPGLENLRIEWLCPEIGIRESVTIRGRETVTAADYEAGRLYPDAVCYAFYGIDEHLDGGRGINARPLGENILPTIPRGALIPRDGRYFLVAGRCLSSDREANSALRVECPCMATGQAAGALAALSARTGVDPADLPMDEARKLLRAHGAIVPGPGNEPEPEDR